MTRPPAPDNDTPYADLGPDTVLDAVDALGFATDGRVLALNSYENRVYRIGIDAAPPLIAKFYRPGRWSDAGIGEEHRFGAELHDADLSVVAPLALRGATLHRHAGYRFALFPMQGGHAPELEHRGTLQQLGRTLARMHAVGARARFAHRPRLDIATFGREPVRYLHQARWLPPTLAASFARLAEALLLHCEAAWQRAGDVTPLRLHGDCHPGNILWRDDQAHFVDLDDCLTGPAVQDLWMLLSGDAAEQRRQFEQLLEGYGEFRDFDWRERHLIEALRTLRLLHYHAWIARRWHDPAFPRAFPWFAEPRHWEGVIVQMQEQLDALQDPAFD
ncbi:serine/threonine protein kinase [Chiayiivirga flava]|uniref:Stress response kinase A n=1 Tax=Chiayiivirga flava TaxID=659595 RepID=A0A7W8D956_9GAMM|nr:serine/threonine protein kinase [Chiayiivirga flava]MBB5209072.1 Ser/Thr protein kinase RdoA (MazF antagonist) [Chiayiivirga flava]